MNNYFKIIALGILIIALIVPAACAKSAEFVVSALAVSPEAVLGGESVKITAYVENVGGGEGTYIAVLKMDGAQVEVREVIIALDTKETVTFTITKDVPGIDQVNLGGISTTLKILKPAEFVISELSTNPTEAEVWEEVEVTTKVENVGEVEGGYIAVLDINGEEVETKEVTIAAGAFETVTFTFIRDVGPSCDIEINGPTKNLTVTEGVPPVLSVGDTWISTFVSDGIEYTETMEVTGEDIIDGKSCYVLEGTYEVPLIGIVDSVSAKYDKATNMLLRIQFSGEHMDMPFVSEST